MSEHFIWIMITGGVIGFTPKEIVEYEVVYDIKLKPLGLDYWQGFNLYFEDVLEAKEAICFSSLWRDDEAWMQLNKLRAAR